MALDRVISTPVMNLNEHENCAIRAQFHTMRKDVSGYRRGQCHLCEAGYFDCFSIRGFQPKFTHVRNHNGRFQLLHDAYRRELARAYKEAPIQSKSEKNAAEKNNGGSRGYEPAFHFTEELHDILSWRKPLHQEIHRRRSRAETAYPSIVSAPIASITLSLSF